MSVITEPTITEKDRCITAEWPLRETEEHGRPAQELVVLRQYHHGRPSYAYKATLSRETVSETEGGFKVRSMTIALYTPPGKIVPSVTVLTEPAKRYSAKVADEVFARALELVQLAREQGPDGFDPNIVALFDPERD